MPDWTDAEGLAKLKALHASLIAEIERLHAEVESLCLDCKAVKSQAWSDATTPGFFPTQCEKHRRMRRCFP